jgi:uncharacterized MAPEG superfamily protein
MTTLLTQPAFQLYAICSACLVVILYALGFMTAKARAESLKLINAEDVGVNPKGAVVVEVESAAVQRVKRAHQNSLENAVPFFVIGFLYTQTDPGMLWLRIFFLTFLVVRTAHAAFYLTAKQPFRTLSFGIGAVINLAMVIQVVRAAVSGLIG